ncbi:MAG: hypothetical protein JNK64_19415 [Myxococcales bacterium]|nr:hypothetical protein [Myxococcales bacterium]
MPAIEPVATFASLVQVTPARGADEDRAAAVARGDGVVLALADGAGGTGGGARAADAVIAGLIAAPTPSSWTDALAALDAALPRLGPGQATAVVVEVTAAGLRGASVGDSGAWLVGDDLVDLTADQRRKPLLGAGATPVAFTAGPLADRTLVLASDGLWKYARPADVADAARHPDLAAAAAALLALVRLPSGGLPDDVALVLARAR